jgi:DNA-binding NarL/FixJ family response regulator
VTRILIAAPSAVTRAGLEALLASNPSLEVVGSFADLSSLDALRPDVVLAAMQPEEVAAASAGPAPAYVLLADGDRPGWTPEALRLGVRAVLPRDASAAAILAAVEAAASGLAVMDPHDLEDRLGASAPLPVTQPNAALTAREREVLRMMADGAANKEIAWKLGISEHTVKFHVASILAKLNASSRTEAVTRGLRQGLILI